MHVGDTIFIFCLALIIFGPKKLPEIGRQIGKLMVEFRRASNEFKMQIEEELRASDEAERQKEITAATTMLPTSAESVAAPAAALSGESASLTVPTITPPVTGLPVNHTFGSDDTSEPVTADPWVSTPAEDAFPETGSDFNSNLNTASNSANAELPEVAEQSQLTEYHAGELPLPESQKAQAPVHHG